MFFKMQKYVFQNAKGCSLECKFLDLVIYNLLYVKVV